MTSTELICINCPRGCVLRVNRENSTLDITGNACPRGIEYANQELTNPVRVLTVLMRIDGLSTPVSVKTDKPVPKDKILDCAKEIYQAHPKSPVHYGDVVLRNVCDTGCNVIVTTDC